jgi:hypothetical protein
MDEDDAVERQAQFAEQRVGEPFGTPAHLGIDFQIRVERPPRRAPAESRLHHFNRSQSRQDGNLLPVCARRPPLSRKVSVSPNGALTGLVAVADARVMESSQARFVPGKPLTLHSR